MAKKLFKYVIFNFKTGTILNTIEPSKDTTLLDINNTGSIELDIPFYTLTNAQRKDISNLFEPINRGIALIRLNELGESIGCVDAGMIVKREFSVEDQSAHIQTTGFSGYLSKIAARWVTDTITTKPAPTYTYSGTPAQIYQSILNGALKNSDGISTIQNWETDFGSNDARTDSLKFPLTDFYTAQDAIEEVRDEIFEGKAAEIRWVPMLIIGSNKIKWVARTSKNDNSLINVGLDPKELPLKSWEPSVREISSYEINEDANDIYNYLVIDASEGDGDNETVFIKAKNETDAGKLTIFQSFDTGVDLSSSQMDSQLNSRLKNADIPEKSGTITLTGNDLSLENIPYSYELDGTNHYVNYGTLGRRIKAIAGSKASGLGTTLRCTEMSLSVREWDTSLTLTLQTITNVYPSLPAQRKLEKKEKKKRTSTKKQKKDRDKKKNTTTKGGDDFTIDSDFNWDGTDSGDPDDTVGGIDTPEKPELEPDKLPDSKPSDYTIGSLIVNLSSSLMDNSKNRRSPIFKHSDGNHYFFNYSYETGNLKSETIGDITLDLVRIPVKRNDENDLFEKIPNSLKKINMISFESIRALALNRFPSEISGVKGIPWNTPNDPSKVSDIEFKINWTKQSTYNKPRLNTYFTCFVINGRFYGQYITQSKSSYYYESAIVSEVFFTADLNIEEGILSNYEILTSPAQQIWGSNGMHKVISLDLITSDNSDFKKSSDSNYATNLPMFDISEKNDNSRVVFLSPDFIFSRKYLEQTGTSGNGWFLPSYTSDEYGISYTEMNTEFGLLQADFRNKQPVWSKSNIQLPFPKQNQLSRLGRVANENYVTTSISDIWIGNFTYAPLAVFKPFIITRNEGIYLTLDSSMTESVFYTFFENTTSYQEFESKYMNRAWFLSRDSLKWNEIKFDSSNTVMNQNMPKWGIVSTDSKPISDIKLDDKYIKTVKSGKNRIKVEGLADISPHISSTRGNYKSVINSYDKFDLAQAIQTNGVPCLVSLKESKYKTEPLVKPTNNNYGFFKSKDKFFTLFQWFANSADVISNMKLNNNIALMIGDDSMNIRNKSDFDKFNLDRSESQTKLNLTIDFSEFGSYAGCNIGLDSNGDLWQWGIKFEKNIPASQSAVDSLYLDSENNINWEPVKINLPFTVKKFIITGNPMSTETYAPSEMKRIVGITNSNDIFIVGYIDQLGAPSQSYLDATVIKVDGNSRMKDVNFTRTGIYAIGDDLSLYVNDASFGKTGTNPDLKKLSSIDNRMSIIDGKIKSLSNCGPQLNSSTIMCLITTSGEVYGYGAKWQTSEYLLKKIEIEDKIISANSASGFSRLDLLIMINENGSILRGRQNSTSSESWINFNYTKLNNPFDKFKPKDIIWDQHFRGMLNFMVEGDYEESVLSKSKAIVSSRNFESQSLSWQYDTIGSMMSDGYIYGSEVDTGSLFPDFDFMPDGEGSEGQDWATNNWLPQTGDGKSPTPGEGEIVTDEGETADGRVAGQIEIPAEWMDESGGEVPPVVAPG